MPITAARKVTTKAYVYLLIITPPREESKRIMRIKQQLAGTLNSGISLSLPHITLAQYFADEENEEAIIRSMRRVAARYSPFPIQLGNYGHFPRHTVYIKVASDDVLPCLSADLRHAIGKRLITHIENRKPHFLSKAHITIVRRLSRIDWCSAVRLLRRLSYQSAFTSYGMCLLKWLPEENRYRQQALLPFTGQDGRSIQLHLF